MPNIAALGTRNCDLGHRIAVRQFASAEAFGYYTQDASRGFTLERQPIKDRAALAEERKSSTRISGQYRW